MRWSEQDSIVCFGTVTGISTFLSGLSDILSVAVLSATFIYTVVRICKELKS